MAKLLALCWKDLCVTTEEVFEAFLITHSVWSKKNNIVNTHSSEPQLQRRDFYQSVGTEQTKIKSSNNPNTQMWRVVRVIVCTAHAKMKGKYWQQWVCFGFLVRVELSNARVCCTTIELTISCCMTCTKQLSNLPKKYAIYFRKYRREYRIYMHEMYSRLFWVS